MDRQMSERMTSYLADFEWEDDTVFAGTTASRASSFDAGAWESEDGDATLADDGDDFADYAEDMDDFLPDVEGEAAGGFEVGISRVCENRIVRGLEMRQRVEPWRSGVYGLIVHATGRGGIWQNGLKIDGNPLHRLMQHYNEKNGPSFINGWGGMAGKELVQMADERVRNKRGVGLATQIRSNAGGGWERQLPELVVRKWRARWPGYDNPLDLLPRKPGSRRWVQPNECYLQVECIPCASGRDAPAKPMRKGLLFTAAQHDAIAALAVDIADRHDWPRDAKWWRSPRLLGHEDLTPYSRSRVKRKNGSIKVLNYTYDPGALKAEPWFDWDYVYERIEALWRDRERSGWLGAVSDKASDTVTSIGDVVSRVVDRGTVLLAVQRAIDAGERREGKLTDVAFFAKHPERGRRRIEARESALAREWKALRADVVRPLLRAADEIASDATASPFVSAEAPLSDGDDIEMELDAEDEEWGDADEEASPGAEDEVFDAKAPIRDEDDEFETEESPEVEDEHDNGEFPEFEEQTARTGDFEHHLREGLRRFRPSKFGTPWGRGGKFQRRHWSWIHGTRHLELKSWLRDDPANAIREIVDNGKDWTVDCAYFVQIAYLYALSQSNPGAFNAKYGGKPFYLRFHWSTGAGSAKYRFRRCSHGAPWYFWYKKKWNKASDRWTDERVLKEAKSGGRVMWCNRTVAEYDPKPSRRMWRNENTIKVGDGLYQAYPYSRGNRDLTELQLRRLLAAQDIATSEVGAIIEDSANASATVAAYERNHIYLKEVTVMRQSL